MKPSLRASRTTSKCRYTLIPSKVIAPWLPIYTKLSISWSKLTPYMKPALKTNQSGSTSLSFIKMNVKKKKIFLYGLITFTISVPNSMNKYSNIFSASVMVVIERLLVCKCDMRILNHYNPSNPSILPKQYSAKKKIMINHGFKTRIWPWKWMKTYWVNSIN